MESGRFIIKGALIIKKNIKSNARVRGRSKKKRPAKVWEYLLFIRKKYSKSGAMLPKTRAERDSLLISSFKGIAAAGCAKVKGIIS
jgi:hypothetical protein